MDLIWEKARDVGRMIAQSDEYGAFKRASQRLSDDREAVTRLNRLQALEDGFQTALQQGTEPPLEEQQEYQRLADEVQAMPGYQSLAAAQSGFDRLMLRVNEEIAKGIEAGEQSRIILTS
jgi:cell fate (sporulation/competence/biofilm development) regulator YlbF (YheA/YmcA/DUF963 family)